MAKIKTVHALENYILDIEFEDGIKIKYDINHRLNHPAFKDLKNRKLFETVTTDGFCLHWTDAIEICIDNLDELYMQEKKNLEA